MLEKVIGFFRICMDQETKKYITLLALDNLINTYKDALDIMQLTQEESDFMNKIILLSQELYNEMYNPQIPKPKWKKDP